MFIDLAGANRGGPQKQNKGSQSKLIWQRIAKRESSEGAATTVDTPPREVVEERALKWLMYTHCLQKMICTRDQPRWGFHGGAQEAATSSRYKS